MNSFNDRNAPSWSHEGTPKQILAIPCPACGAKRGEKCELNSSQLRNTARRDRRLAAEETARQKAVADH
jgi:hypothetical protein